MDQLKSTPRISNLVLQAAGEFCEKVAVLACGGLGVTIELSEVVGQQRMLLGIKQSDVSQGMPYLARQADDLGCVAFTRNRGVNLPVVFQKTVR